MRKKIEGTSANTLESTVGMAQEWLSPAKVNLWLAVTGRRPDGYHLLDSLMVPVDLCDRIRVRVTRQGSGHPPFIAVSCNDPSIPQGRGNLAWRAAELLLGSAGVSACVDIEIEKTIPTEAGLGGGSSNAGTVLRALNDLLELNLESSRLQQIGVKIGADVPFFISCVPARVRGIGELVVPHPLPRKLQLVIALPRVRVATAWAFARFDSGLTRGSKPRKVSGFEDLGWHGAGSMFNDLEETVMTAHPAVREAKEALVAAGASGAVMSGSGSAVVGLINESSKTGSLMECLRKSIKCDLYAVSTLDDAPAPGLVATI